MEYFAPTRMHDRPATSQVILTIGQDAAVWEVPLVQCGTWRNSHACETKEASAQLEIQIQRLFLL